MSTTAMLHSRFSPVPIRELRPSKSALVADWDRSMNSNLIKVNGEPLHKYAKAYLLYKPDEDQPQRKIYKFDGEEMLKAFFNTLLPSALNDAEKQNAVKQLVTIFHQGGLLHPVSSSFYCHAAAKMSGMVPSAALGDCTKEIDITTTKTGFEVREQYTLIKFIETPQAHLGEIDKVFPNHVKEEDASLATLVPDNGNPYVVQVTATLHLAFKPRRDKPLISLLSNKISYGNEDVKKVLDTRSIAQIIFEFFANLFGKNQSPPDSSSRNKQASKDDGQLSDSQPTTISSLSP